MTEYYDFVLALIPLAMIGITGTLHVGGLAFTSAIPVAGVVAFALIGHALFVRTPVDREPVDDRSSTNAGGPAPSAD